MNASLRKFICSLAIASLLIPAPAMANSLRLRNNLTLPPSSKEDDTKLSGIPDLPKDEKQTGKAGTPNNDTDLSRNPEKTDDGKDPQKPGKAAPVGESIKSLAEPREDLTNEKLDIPSNAKEMEFLKGNWGFDHVMLDSKGRKLRSDFTFNEEGRGTASLVDEDGIRYTAGAKAFMEDGALKIKTSPYTSAQSSRSYNNEFIECRNSDGEFVCRSSGGFSTWNGQHMMRSKASALPPEPAPRPQKPVTETNGFGPELPSNVKDTLPKAKIKHDSEPLSALNGSWRYSRDLLSKEDGQNLGLEFHFDKNGRGYSVLKNGASQEFKADASATALSDGTLLVKTSEYQNGSDQIYHPTFMECRPGVSSELDCSVSNGWSRSEGGSLLAKSAFDRQEGQIDVSELTAQNTASKTKSQFSSDEHADILADMADKLNQNNQATSEMLMLNEREEGTMSFLEGGWLCDTGLYRASDSEPITVEFFFDKNGAGEAVVRERSGKPYTAKANATYKNGTLRINTSDYYGPTPDDGKYSRSTITCQNEGGYALCRGRNGGARWSNARFIRIK